MPSRVLVVLAVALALMVLIPSVGAVEDAPRFQLGFKTLAEMIPDIAGEPLENEHHNHINGDGLQITTTGLMVWRKADNWTAFTNGWWTWVNGPFGLQDRSNFERFDWEADAASYVAAPAAGAGDTPRPEASYSPTPAPSGTIGPASTGTPLPEASVTLEPSPTYSALPSSTATGLPSPTATRTSSPTLVPTSTREPTPTRQPTATREPTATRTPTPTRTATPVPTFTATPTTQPDGIRSPDPAGNWVTSTVSTTRYYCSRDSSYWSNWSATNRVWFQTEAALLAAYPGRVKHD